MEHLYSVFGGDYVLHSKHFLDDSNSNVISSMSNNNIFAFTSYVDLFDPSEKLLGVFVYVVDPNLPHFPYKVKQHDSIITVLEWDNRGTKLLIGDEFGNIEIWSMKDFLISHWQNIYSYCFAGERILKGIWFHQGIKLTINYGKKDLNVPYQEKFHFTKIGASVVQFGSKHTDGFMCITSSGLVYAHLFCSDGKIITDYDFVNNCRFKMDKVDIAYMKNGTFLLLATNGNSKTPISCFNINISLNFQEKQKLKITCQLFSHFTMKTSIDNLDLYPKVNDIRFVVKEIPDAVTVVASGKSGSIIELWELREKSISFSNVIQNLMQQQNKKIETSQNILGWNFSSSTTSSSQITVLSTPRISLFETNPPLSYIIVAYKDKSIKCFYRDSLKMIANVNLANTLAQHQTNVAVNSTKMFGHSNLITGNRTVSYKLSNIRDIQISWSSCSMIAIDSYSQLFFFRLSPIISPNTPMNINYAQLMLEYSLLSGNDYWDILINIKPMLVENLCERITENFITKQPHSIQQKWLDNILQMKAALYRCVNPGPSTNSLCKSGDYYTIKMLNAISETIKRLIRAREYQENEGPAEKLGFLIQNKPTDPQFLNVDKILLKLDNKDFCVEPVIQQSFQHLLQWVCDLSLYLLASIPQQYHQNQYRLPGAGLIFDFKSINTLRELLVIIRFWGLINATFIPSFVKMQDSLDVIFIIFKLLSKIVASSPDKMDETFLDECCVLPNQVMIPQMDLCPKSIGVASPSMYNNPLPLTFQYGIEPQFMKYNIKVHTIDGAKNVYGNRRMDVLRYISLGTVDESSTNIRSCTRCSSVSLLKSPMRSPAARAWDQQWIKKCFCGGYWRIHNSKNYKTTI